MAKVLVNAGILGLFLALLGVLLLWWNARSNQTPMGAAEMADLIERYLDGTSRYPQE